MIVNFNVIWSIFVFGVGYHSGGFKSLQFHFGPCVLTFTWAMEEGEEGVEW